MDKEFLAEETTDLNADDIAASPSRELMLSPSDSKDAMEDVVSVSDSAD